MRVIEGLLDKETEDRIESYLLHPQFPWYFRPKSSGSEFSVEGFQDTVQFEHNFSQHEYTSPFFQEFIDVFKLGYILKKLDLPNGVRRMKSNLLLNAQLDLSNTPHTDSKHSHLVLLYYVNNSDGPTVFYTDNEVEEKVHPEKGKIVIFDGSYFHSSTPPVEHQYRCVVNINLKS